MYQWLGIYWFDDDDDDAAAFNTQHVLSIKP
jgi:hypothetical protein